MTEVVRPGDVLVVHDPGFWAWIIRLGPWLHNLVYGTGQPTKWNHVVIVMPDDARGNRWGIEGRPGGVGWVDLEARGYLTSKLTLSNAAQPKTDKQRADICAVMELLVARHTGYDWPAIAVDVVRELNPLWALPDTWGTTGTPAHVVCSSAADLAYDRVGLASPRPDRFCTPWDWAMFDIEQAWT